MVKNDLFDFNINPFSSVKQSKRDSRRSFTRTQQKDIWAQQNGKCSVVISF